MTKHVAQKANDAQAAAEVQRQERFKLEVAVQQLSVAKKTIEEQATTEANMMKIWQNQIENQMNSAKQRYDHVVQEREAAHAELTAITMSHQGAVNQQN